MSQSKIKHAIVVIESDVLKMKGNGNAHMDVVLEDETETTAFWYYSDELTFSPSDVIGKTIDEACALKQARDVAYLQSP